MTGLLKACANTAAALVIALSVVASSTSHAQSPSRETLPAPRETLPPPGENVPPPAGTQPTAPEKPVEFIEDVRILGNQTVPLKDLQLHIKTRADRPFDRELVEEDVRRLIAARRFVTVDVTYQRGPKGGRIIIFRVVERPTLKYVKYVGNSVRDRTLDKHSNLKAGDAADPFMVTEAARKLEEYYQGKGFPQVRVTVFEGDRPGDRGAVFLINEGQKQRVWQVTFIGNTIATDARLKTQIQSKPPILMVFKGEFDRKKIDEDVDRLITYYRGLGFFRARIGREITFDEDNDWINLTFVIDEGPRYKIRDIQLVGNTKISTEELREKIKLKPGDYFDRTTLDADVHKVEDAFGSIGYVFSAVEPATTFMEHPGELDLILRIEEGARYRIGKINVHIDGDNPRTRRNTVLNRVSLYPGQIADIRELRDSERRLKASGLFMNNAAEGITPKVVFREPGMEDIDVAERPSRGSGGSARGGAGGGGGGRHRGGVRGQSPDGEPNREGVIDVDVQGRLRPEVRRDVDEPLQAPHRPAEPLAYRAQSPAGPAVYGSTSYGSAAGQVPMGRLSPDSSFSARPANASPALNQLAQTQYQQPANGYSSAPAAAAPTASTPALSAPYQPGTTYLPQNGYPQNTYQPSPPVYSQPAPQGAYAAPNYGQPPTQIVPPGNAVPAAPGYPPNTLPPRPPGVDQSDLYERSPFMPGYGSSDGSTEPIPRPLDVDVRVQETQTGRIQLGVGVNSNAGVMGTVLIDEQNFDWRRIPTSWEDIRNGTAFRGGGQQFRIEAMPGSIVSRYAVTYRDPYFLDTPNSLSMSASYFNRYYQNWTEGRTGGRIGLGRQFTPDLSGSAFFRGESVNISQPTVPTPPELAAVLGNNGLYGLGADLIHDTRDSAFLPTQGHYIKFGFEEVTGTFTYPRGTFEGRQFFMLHERPDRSGRHVLSLTTDVGISGTHTPIYENYYAGGFSSMRGFYFRGVTPRNMGVQIGGRFQWLNSVEYMFPITADDMLRGVIFSDFGTVEQNVEVKAASFRVALGAGVRVTIPAMGPAPIAVDFAAPINMVHGDQVQNIAFFVGYNR